MSPSQSIPAKIQQIWVGGTPPTELVAMSRTWRDLNPEFEYQLWDDAAVANLDMVNRGLYERADRLVPLDAIGQFKADLLRYEIIFQQGGFYCDLDTTCLSPIASALAGRDTFAVSEDNFWIANTYIGASPRHPVMKALNEGIAASVARHPRRTRPNKLTGPQYLTPIYEAHYGHVDPTDLWFAGGSYTDVKVGAVNTDYGEAYASHYWFHTRQVLRRRGRTDV